MRSTPLSIVALIGLGVSLGATAIAVPASAAPVNAAMSKNLASQDASSALIQVQRRRGHSRRGGHRGRGRNNGAAAAGVLGGLLLGGIIANQAQQNRQSEVEYCMDRFNSYDPRSGTYLGYDGYRHSCP